LNQLAVVEDGQVQPAGSKFGGRTWVAPRPVWAAICATLIAASGLVVYGRIGPAKAAGHWNQFFALNLAASGPDDDDNRRGLSASFGEVSRLDPTTIQTLAGHLEKTLAADERNARAHVRMASICIRKFELAQLDSENAMALSQIRDAALASQFPTPEAQDEWLSRAIGDNRRLLDEALAHAKRAAELCPLQGRAYVYLSQLAFLEGPEPERKRAYVDQALKVRPHAGEVLIAAGAEAIFEGQHELAMEHWRKAFRQGPSYQRQIVEIVAHTAPAEFVFEQFQPDMHSALLICNRYEELGMPEQAAYAAGQYARLIEQEAQTLPADEAAKLWEKAQVVYTRLGAWPQALAAAEQAARLAPQDYDKRLAHARLLLEEERYDDAVEEFQWCLARKPNDAGLKAAHTRAQQGRYRRASGVAPADFVEPLR
jgi:tetratricopeptide (TPR) repeat protein